MEIVLALVEIAGPKNKQVAGYIKLLSVITCEFWQLSLALNFRTSLCV